ncbi:hypothetical protein EDB92DRAFT_840694 [Lactarius akahatsu]|uniref:Uncharacterized protein n=1 Tax=Lactarius akahatsu TaxID=416441 RepID=A0AAD4Q789_9AGAM|nr:hypothetical protein EDB92DRAFT_840694 [Lactarius akahatsu]
MLWANCHDSRLLPFTGLPQLHLLVPRCQMSIAPSHSPPLHSSISPPLREIVGSHSLTSSYRLSPRCASTQNLVTRTAATSMESSTLDSMPSARVAFSVVGKHWSFGSEMIVFHWVMRALPLDGLVTLTAQNHTWTLNRHFWLLCAPRWSLLQRVRLAPPAERGFLEILLDDHEGRESPLLPSLTTLILVDTALLERRALHLCDALMKRVEQGVPLETLDLRKCLATSRAIELLSEIVVDVLGPEETLKTGSQIRSESYARGIYLEDESNDNSGVEEDYDSDEDSADTGSDDAE